jgi:hypothetical protein
MLAKLVIVRIFHFVKIILVQLADKAGEIGVFEHSWQDSFRKLVHVLFSMRDDRS